MPPLLLHFCCRPVNLQITKGMWIRVLCVYPEETEDGRDGECHDGIGPVLQAVHGEVDWVGALVNSWIVDGLVGC